MNLFIDIETRPGVKPDYKVTDVPVPKTYKKAESIAKYQEDNYEQWCLDQWHKQALNSMQGQVWAIGYAFDNDPVNVLIDTEENMLKALNEAVRNLRSIKWIGHNVKGFDLVWLYHKAMQYNLEALRFAIPKERYSKAIYDTMEKWNPYKFDYVKLDDIARFLGLPVKLDFNFAEMWINENAEEILHDYCKHDVELTRNIYYKMI